MEADVVKGLQFSVRVDFVGLWFAKWSLEGDLTPLPFTTDTIMVGRAVRRSWIILAE